MWQCFRGVCRRGRLRKEGLWIARFRARTVMVAKVWTEHIIGGAEKGREGGRAMRTGCSRRGICVPKKASMGLIARKKFRGLAGRQRRTSELEHAPQEDLKEVEAVTRVCCRQ